MDTKKFREEMYHKYLNKDMMALKRICDKILTPFSVEESELDDFYSIANYELYKILGNTDDEMQYDKDKCNNFHAYLVYRVRNKILQQITYNNRDVRMQKENVINPYTGEVETNYIRPFRLDAKLNNDTEDTYADLLEQKVEDPDVLSDTMKEYLDGLSVMQKDILHMLYEGFTIIQIKEALGINQNKYDTLWKDMTSFKKLHKLGNLYKCY